MTEQNNSEALAAANPAAMAGDQVELLAATDAALAFIQSRLPTMKREKGLVGIWCDAFRSGWIASSRRPSTFTDAQVEAALIAGWNACRTDIYRLCEDMQEKPFADGGVLRGLGPTPSQEAHSKGFNAGWAHAAKSIARAFSSFEAKDADRIIEARAALSAASIVVGEKEKPVEGWQPIETAPKDGTWVLAGHWHAGKWVYRLAAFNNADYMQSWHDMPGRHASYATHWQPLPTQPSEAK